MKSKGLLVVIVLVLLFFCLIAIGVGGFFGYKWYKGRAAAAEQTQLTEETPQQEPWASESTEPAPTEEPAPSEPEPQEEARPAEPEPAPAPYRAPAPVQPKPKPRPPAPAPSAPAPSGPMAQPSPAEPAPAYEEAAPKVKTPKGSLGVIFETKLDEGQVTIAFNGQVLASEAFTASSDNRYRLEKSMNLIPGPHRIRVTVVASGKTYEKEWTAMVVERQSTVWKAEMNRFPKELVVKPIAQ
jgi:cytoskeletal protein RodZ